MKNNTTRYLVLLICLCAFFLEGCGPSIIRSQNPPPEGVWEMMEGAYVVNYSDPGKEDPLLSLEFESHISPNVRAALESPKQRATGLGIYAHLPASTRLRIKEVYWKETTLFSGFWVVAEIVSGEDAGMTLTLPDLFKVVTAKEGGPQSFKFEKQYYAIEPAGSYVRMVAESKE